MKIFFQVDNWFVKARITKSNPQVPKNQIQDQKSNEFNVSQFHVKNSASVNVNKIESLQGKGATADPDDLISQRNYHQNIPVKVENMNDDDKNNAVQDNQVSSTGQNNSPPSEFFKEDSLDDIGKYIIFTILCFVYHSGGCLLISNIKTTTYYCNENHYFDIFCEMNFV